MDVQQPTPFLRIANRMMGGLLRMGLPVGKRSTPMYVLTVPGRVSGRPRSTPVALTSDGDDWILASVFGMTDWARNLEAAGSGEITRGLRTTRVDAIRLEPALAAPVLREGLAMAPGMVKDMTAPTFEADDDSPLEVWERETVHHPVFRLTRSD